MTHKQLTTENILSLIDGQTLFNKYLQPFHKHNYLKSGVNISNPFLNQIQKTPSFNYYQSSNGNCVYNDFATDDNGDIFSLVMKLNNCDFKQSLELINTDFSLGLIPLSKTYAITHKSFSESDLNYWEQYQINHKTLVKYNVSAINNYTNHTKEGKEYTITSKPNDPIFTYEINKDKCYKLYRPLSPEKRYKFLWLGSKPNDFIFGYEQLPENGNSVYIVGGEKDVLTMSAQGFDAISMNSETTLPSLDLINELKDRFKKVIILYDIDDTGINQSIKICDRYNLSRAILPKKLKDLEGKDVSDYIKLGLKFKDITKENFKQKIDPKSDLFKILKSKRILRQNKSKDIKFSQPIINRHDIPLIYPNTINVIQGKSGTHKSRFAETICSSILKKNDCTNDMLGISIDTTKKMTVCYVDTERNLSDQLPYSIQQIQKKAGYKITDDPRTFDYISLLEINRDNRFEALRSYINHLNDSINDHLFIVLDVITDCLKDFNRSEDSMKLIDLMNKTINQYDVTFLCIIHENPGSADKARGHLGTEIMNKSTTVIQINFEQAKNGDLSDLIRVKFLKCRNTKRPEVFHLEFDEELKQLVEAPSDRINEIIEKRVQSASFPEMLNKLKIHLSKPTPLNELVELLKIDFDCGEKTIRNRLKVIIDTKKIIINSLGNKCLLIKEKEGNKQLYSLGETQLDLPDCPF